MTTKKDHTSAYMESKRAANRAARGSYLQTISESVEGLVGLGWLTQPEANDILVRAWRTR